MRLRSGKGDASVQCGGACFRPLALLPVPWGAVAPAMRLRSGKSDALLRGGCGGRSADEGRCVPVASVRLPCSPAPWGAVTPAVRLRSGKGDALPRGVRRSIGGRLLRCACRCSKGYAPVPCGGAVLSACPTLLPRGLRCALPAVRQHRFFWEMAGGRATAEAVFWGWGSGLFTGLSHLCPCTKGPRSV